MKFLDAEMYFCVAEKMSFTIESNVALLTWERLDAEMRFFVYLKLSLFAES